VQIRYNLNDASQKAAQKISVQVVYYDNVSDVPGQMQREVEGKRANMFNYKIIKGKPRPPFIIIAGFTK
jgi:hypothetical protein